MKSYKEIQEATISIDLTLQEIADILNIMTHSKHNKVWMKLHDKFNELDRSCKE